jgi:tetratricopeptide (TPR) repeat protein
MPIAPDSSGGASAQLRVVLQRAVAFHQHGDLNRARELYEHVLALQPADADAWHLLGVVAAQMNQPARAVELIETAIGFDPANFAAYGNLGSALHSMRRLPEALSAFDRAIALKPDFHQAHLHRGNLLYELKRHEAALASYDAAVAVKPDLAEAHSNRGNVLQALGRLEAALASYAKAISINPELAEAHCNRGNVLRELDRFDEAFASYDRALAIDANFVPAHFNRGVALNQLRRLPAALACYDRAIAIDEDFAEAHFNRALLWLLTGDFARGWPEHEWRWKNRLGSNIHERRDFAAPLWRGRESLTGSTILLYSEQGFGDTLQWCRYAPLVANLGAEVILEVPRPLEPLLSNLRGVSRIVIRGSVLPHFDYQCPLMSLPLAFQTDLASIPSAGSYLRSDPAKVSMWQQQLGTKAKPRIGLMWNGNPVQPNDRNRSVWLADWLPHLPPGFQYVSLQRELRAADAKTLDLNTHIFNPAEQLGDFSDTAALCDCMDLVISVCTSVAHLSGALGRRTWILLAFAADWRWLLDRTDSPWYPSATLYRQPARGDWISVFQRVARDLRRTFP